MAKNELAIKTHFSADFRYSKKKSDFKYEPDPSLYNHRREQVLLF